MTWRLGAFGDCESMNEIDHRVSNHHHLRGRKAGFIEGCIKRLVDQEYRLRHGRGTGDDLEHEVGMRTDQVAVGFGPSTHLILPGRPVRVAHPHPREDQLDQP
jgi:hypothetical protein